LLKFARLNQALLCRAEAGKLMINETHEGHEYIFTTEGTEGIFLTAKNAKDSPTGTHFCVF
jgi:hypothetical protein